mmetsp:Transcript_4/g.10  ORF Transcript_4/g.10 Transcript_4/m.10 type:complete len:338 (+) Transcript_4:173-1186(+)|eukprot:CAMPEP_0114505556 /NCGR_PEP_ID=MMETSP0109-20121206/10917_1 /TAXON_ID=29199 /ORGANISM="Chlorarachnion reptans, Strain CCCM449" /LENGTH=337 /DNA_ID=CAMNT_0001684005 /DNA_START=153 /DNA_END=1166 /DNA_ORIENTATION=+
MGKFSKDKRDIYYRRAKEEGYRARSAYKLLHIRDGFDIFANVSRVVDLCAAPGGWSQVIARQLAQGNTEERQDKKGDVPPKIVSVDLMTMRPIEGVFTLVGDITRELTVSQIISRLGGAKAQLVVCDGAPDVIGLHDVDEYVQHQLVSSALQITTNILEEGGTFVAKAFRGPNSCKLIQLLEVYFETVVMSKPKACRNSSVEGFVVCLKYKPPREFIPSMSTRMNFIEDSKSCSDVRFKACGPHTWDSDQSYPLNIDAYSGKQLRSVSEGTVRPNSAAKLKLHEQSQKRKAADAHSQKLKSKREKYCAPTAPPIDPPYKKFLELRRKNKLNTKKTRF